MDLDMFNKNHTHLGAVEVTLSSYSIQKKLLNISKIHSHFLVNKEVFDVKAWKVNNSKVKYKLSIEVELLQEEIEETQKEVIFKMGSIGKSRSRETGNHVRRVAEYSKLFALKYGLNQTDAKLLKQASPKI